MFAIDKSAKFKGIRAAEIFFEPLQLHLQLAVAVRRLRSSTAETALPPCPCFSCPVRKARWHFPGAGAFTGSPEWGRPERGADRSKSGVLCCDLLDRPATTDRLHGDLPQAEALG